MKISLAICLHGMGLEIYGDVFEEWEEQFDNTWDQRR